jgi:hypothetical protein
LDHAPAPTRAVLAKARNGTDLVGDPALTAGLAGDARAPNGPCPIGHVP